jgi:O-antigen/teichoic acid export membrane protein
MVYLATSGFWMNAQVLFLSVGSLFLAIAFANLLPAETYGVYQYLLSFSTIIGALTLTGMNYAVTQAVARGYEGVVRESVRTQLRWSVIPLLCGIGVGVYYLLQGNAELGYGLFLIGVFTPLIYAFNTYIAFLNGKKEFKQTFVYGVVLNGAYYGSILLATVYLKEALLLLLVNLLVNAAVTVALYMRTLARYRPNRSIDTETLPYGKHLSLMYVPTLVIRQLDNILVFQMLGPVQLAVYSFASTVPERIAGFFKFAFTAALPKFSTRTRESIQSSLLSKMMFMTAAGLVIALLYIAAAPYVFALLFPAYLEAIPYSQLYALLIVASASNLSTSALLSQQLKRELYIFYTVTPFVQLTFQVALLWSFGLWGLIVGRIISSVLDTVVSTALFYWYPQKR